MTGHADDGTPRIGENVRNARLYRGLSLDALAGLAGRSKGWLSKVENGRTRLERRSDIRALAEALEVSASDLLGEPVPAIRPQARAYGDIVRLREALLDSSLDDPLDVPVRPLADLADLTAGPIEERRLAADYAGLAAVLPPALAELHVHATTGDERARTIALRLLIDVCACTTFLLRHLGQVDLAWIAADRARKAAVRLDDPVMLGAAAFVQAHARPAASLGRALREAARTADALEGGLGDDRLGQEVYGMLQLSAALAHRVRHEHGHAADRLAEAERMSRRTGERAGAWQSFGPANVGTWKAMLAVEADEPAAALEAAAAVDVEALANRGRRAALAIEQGRALAMLGRDAQAVRQLRRAEHLSAARVHNNPMVRELVADLYERAAGRDLRGLAWRMNLI
ncbi:helix-turn-helix domain-containing protein [Actinomadura sp. 21ATH]|uniref:helix-turn-helix domain-containing protein n=1 Tax=Actinomadura sp. 21ATH TaxID=1735444 RepID=UPI0035C1F107